MTAPKGVKLPTIDATTCTLDGNLQNWQTFGEQISVAIHDRPRSSDTEKLVYLQNSGKDRLATKTIERHSQSGDQ